MLLTGIFYGLAALDPLLNAAYLPVGAPKFYLTSLVLPVLVYGLALWAWLQPSAAIPLPAATAETPLLPTAPPTCPPPKVYWAWL